MHAFRTSWWLRQSPCFVKYAVVRANHQNRRYVVPTQPPKFVQEKECSASQKRLLNGARLFLGVGKG